RELAAQAEALGLKTKVCSPSEVQELEPSLEVDVAGGVLYYDDAHVHAGKLMRSLYQYLLKNGVKFWLNTDVQRFEKTGSKVTAAITDKGTLHSDAWVIANGSWMGLLAKKLNLNIPLQPGKGYSMSFDNMEKNLHHPAILVDHRTATTPVGNWL